MDRSNRLEKTVMLEIAGRVVRLSPWYGSDGAVLVGMAPQLWQSDSSWLTRVQKEAAERGFSALLIQATSAVQRAMLERMSFEEVDELHVLFKSLRDTLPSAPVTAQEFSIRRTREVDLAEVLRVDNRCFEPFWMMNEAALLEATMATPRYRFRIATAGHNDEIVGYAISGLGAGEGYLQRIAVDPEWQGRGFATSLVVDGLRWAKRWRARRVGVNTQKRNETAFRLYCRLGFVAQSEGISIYRWNS
ncbi:MAG: GNAT family N-acetyltransferase [Ferrimicrobium sp.]